MNATLVGAVQFDLVARFDDGVAEIVEQGGLLRVRLHGALDLIDRPAGDLGGLVVAALRHALRQRRHARRRARPPDIVFVVVRGEDRLVDVAIAVDPERIDVFVIVGPQRVIEEVAVGIGPEQRADPAEMMVGMPAVMPPIVPPKRPECGVLGEATPILEMSRIGRVSERPHMRIRQCAVSGLKLFVAQVVVPSVVGGLQGGGRLGAMTDMGPCANCEAAWRWTDGFPKCVHAFWKRASVIADVAALTCGVNANVREMCAAWKCARHCDPARAA